MPKVSKLRNWLPDDECVVLGAMGGQTQHARVVRQAGTRVDVRYDNGVERNVSAYRLRQVDEARV